MNVTKETITPKKAMEWLKRNVANRPLSMVDARKWASAMRSKKWMLNGETIKFNCNGDLIDGQHRLTGCVEAGVPFTTYVVRGLPHEAFDTLDQGKKRSGGDVLARRGEKHYNMLAAAISITAQIHNKRTVDLGSAMRADEYIAFLEQHPGLRECCSFSSQHRSDGLLATAVVAGLLYLFRQVDAIRADEFWTRVLVGEDLTRDMPEYKLRSRLIDNKASAAKLRRRDLCALAIKSWNNKLTGKQVKALAFFDREEFPLIHGYKYPSA